MKSEKTTVYYMACHGRSFPLFDGTRFAPVPIDSTKPPTAVSANKNYDLFVWDDIGTTRLSRRPSW
jgi:hypothetical protein